jgi:hypothetical protein
MKSTHLLVVVLLVIGVLITEAHVGESEANASSSYSIKALHPSQHANSTEQRLFDLNQGNQNVPSVRSQESAPGAPNIPLTSWTTESASGDWHVECVDCPKWFYMTNQSLRLDSDGYPHLAYGGEHLYYAWHDLSITHMSAYP